MSLQYDLTSRTSMMNVLANDAAIVSGATLQFWALPTNASPAATPPANCAASNPSNATLIDTIALPNTPFVVSSSNAVLSLNPSNAALSTTVNTAIPAGSALAYARLIDANGNCRLQMLVTLAGSTGATDMQLSSLTPAVGTTQNVGTIQITPAGA